MVSFRWASVVLVCLALAQGDACGDDADVARARELLRGYQIAGRRSAIEMLVKADSAAAVQLLEDAIKTAVKEMDKVAKDLDKLDLRYDEALGYWESARGSGDAYFYELATRYFDKVKRDWGMTAARLDLLLEVAVDAGSAFAKLSSPGALRGIDAGARTESDPFVRKWYVDGIAPRGRRLGGIPTLLRLATSPDPITRSMALRALRPAAMDRRVFDVAVTATADRAWQARVAAYEIVARAPLDQAAPRLVAAAGIETGEIALVVDDLLHRLTGATFAQDPRQWGPFWTEHGVEVLDGSFALAAPEAPDAGARTVETFFSIPIASTNVLFCLDYSASMEEELEHDDVRNIEVRTKWKLPASRLGVAQAETIRAIRGLPSTARMNLVVFSDKAKRFSGRPVVATDSGKASAISWLLAQKTGWLTNVHDGLKSSFDDVLAIGGSAQRFVDLPDAIVFLTDGSPTRGRFQDERTLTSLVALWNAPVGATILAVGVGKEHATELLTSLAKQTRGSYLDVASRKPATRAPRVSLTEDERREPTSRTLASVRETFAGDATTAERVAAVRRAAEIADWSPDAMDLCVERLGDGDGEVRDAVVGGLGTLPSDFAPALVERLGPHLAQGVDASDEACDASLRLVAALGTSAADAVEALVRLVGSVASSHRVAAAKALGAIGPPAARVAVAPLLATRVLPTTDAELKSAIDAALNKIRR